MFTSTITTFARREPKRTGRTVVVAAALDADDQAGLADLFDGLSGPIDRVVVTAEGERIALAVARSAVARMRPGGTLELTDAALAPRFAAALEVALAPVRIRVVAPNEVDHGRQVLARAA